MAIKKTLMLCLATILFISGIAFAQPGIPNQFYGTIKFADGKSVGAGFKLISYVNGDKAQSTYTLNRGYGSKPYIFFVLDPEGNYASSKPTISFKLYDANTGHTYSISKTAIFTKGAHTELDLKTTENYIPIASRGGGGGSTTPTTPIAPNIITTGEEEETPAEEKTKIDEVLDLIAEEKTQEAELLLEEIKAGEKNILEIADESKSLAIELAIGANDLEELELTADDYQDAVKDMNTIKKLLETVESIDNLEDKARIIKTTINLNNQIKEKIPTISKLTETKTNTKSDDNEIKKALNYATEETTKTNIDNLKNKKLISTEKYVKIYSVENKKTGKTIYKSIVIIKIPATQTEIIEVIPKQIAQNADDIIFKGIQPIILQHDPIVKFAFDDNNNQEEISYIISKNIDKASTITLAATGEKEITKTTQEPADTSITPITGRFINRVANPHAIGLIILIVLIVGMVVKSKPKLLKKATKE